MKKDEMEKKRDLLALEKREPYELEYRNIVGALFCAGWDACSEEYEKYITDLRIGIISLNNKILEQAVAIENVKEKLSKAIQALEEAAEYHNTDDVNGEAGYIAWKLLNELKINKF